jgi:hypothetical protein
MAFIHDRQSPDQQLTQDVERSSILKTIATTAMSFIGYGIGVRVGKAISFKANVGIGKFMAKLASPTSTINKTIDAATSALTLNKTRSQTQDIIAASKMVRSLRVSSRRAIGKIQTSLEGGVRTGIEEGRYSDRLLNNVRNKSASEFHRYGQFSGKKSDFLFTDGGLLKDIRATTILSQKSFAGRVKIGSHRLDKTMAKLRSDAIYAKENSSQGVFGTLKLLRNPTKNVDIGRALRGKAYAYGTYLGSFAAADYAMYNITMPSDKKWYDPRKVAEWASFTVLTDLPMRNAMPNAKKAMEYIGGKTSQFLQKNDLGKSIVSSMLPRAQKIASMVTPRAAAESWDKLAGHNSADSAWMEKVKVMAAGADEFSKTRLRMSREIRRVEQPSAIRDAIKHLETIDETLTIGNKSTKENVYKQLKEANPDADPNKWLGSINKLFGTDIKSTIVNFDHPFNKGESKRIFGGAGAITYGGKDYNLENLLPKKIATRMFNFAHENFKIGNFKPLSVLGIKPHLDAKANTFALYTNQNSDGFMHIATGYDLKDIDAKLGKISEDKNAMLNELIKTHNDPNLTNANEMMEGILSGKLPTNEDHAIIKNLHRQESDLNNAKEFVEYYKGTREFRPGYVGKESQIDMDLKRGFVKLKDDEYVHFIGDKMYFGAREGGNKNFKVWQLGYDANAGVYHSVSNITSEHAGGLLKIFSNMRGFNEAKGLGGASHPQVKGRVNPDDGAFRKITMGIADSLEIGNKTEHSIFGTAMDYVTKLFHPKTLKNMFGKIIENPTFLDNLAREEVDTFHKVLQTRSKEMNVFLSNEFFNKSSFVNDVSEFARNLRPNAASPESQATFDFFKSGNFMIKGEPNLSLSEYNQSIKTKAVKLRSSLESVFNSANQDLIGVEDSAIRMKSNELQLLNKIVNHANPTELLHQQYSNGLKYKDAFNSLSFRTFYDFVGMEQKDQLFAALKSGSMSQELRHNVDMLNLTSMINTYQGVNLNQLTEAQLSFLGSNVSNTISKNPTSARKIADQMEKIWKPSGLHDNLEYPNARYTPANIAISRNKDLEGKSIYSIGEQIMGYRKFGDGGRYEAPVTGTSLFVSQALNAINNTGHMIGLGFQQDAIGTVAEFGKRVALKRILPAMALMQAYQVADAFFDESQLFDGTQLGEGLSVLGASIFAQGRLGMAGINDALGVTDVSKYMEDIMPGSVNSPLMHAVRGIGSPLAGMAMGAKFGGPGGAMIGGAIGASISLLTSGGPLGAMGKFDITKSRSDLIEEYAGRRRVPVYKGAGWLISPTPIGGSKIESFETSWFHQIQSQYKYTNSLYGGKFERLMAGIDYNHYGEKHEFSRPYPTKERVGSDIPIIGQTIAIGGGIQNEEELKFAMYANALGGGDRVNLSGFDMNPTGGLLGNGGGSMLPGTPVNSPFGPAYTTEGGLGGDVMQQTAVLPGSAISRMNYAAKQAADFFGLRGFLADTAFKSMNDGLMPYEDIPKLESASWMSSPARGYWDANLGDMAGMNEFVRRFIPKHGQNINDVNPLPALGIPKWLAQSNDLKDFSKGDIYTKIARGESRLPGAGYEAMNAVNFDFPLEAEYMGRSFENTLAMMTGNYMPTTEDEKYDFILGGKMAQRVKESLSMSNVNVQEGKTLFDPRLNMSGKIDMFINGVATKTKVVSNDTFKRLDTTPQFQHMAEMNGLLMMSGGKIGSVMYINAENGETKNISVRPDEARYTKDLSEITRARLVSKNLVNQYGPSIGVNMGNAYSRLDRLKILADVSPFSDEMQQTLQQVRTQNKLGLLSAGESVELDNVMAERDKVMQRYINTEYKFNRGTAVTAEERNFQSSIKDDYNIIERTVGSLWEGFAHQNTILQKGLNIGSAVEQYERYELYGMPLRNWETPYQSFVRPYATSFLSKDNPVDGATSLFTAGMVFGGPGGAAIGAAAGGIYGAVNSAFGFGQVPGYRQEERDLTENIDRIRYEKAKAVYDATGSLEAQKEMSRTMTFQYQNATTIRGLYAGTPKHERAFIRNFAQSGTEEERARIMDIMPDYVKPMLNKAWTGTKVDLHDPGLQFVTDPDFKPSQQWGGWNANIATDDIAVKMFQREGLDAHNAGLGWQSQMRKMKYKQGIPDTFAPEVPTNNINADIQSIVKSIIPGAQVNVLNTGGPGISVTLA